MQQLVSCDVDGTDAGCDGGLMDEAFKWIVGHPLCVNEDYPYLSGSGQYHGLCQTTCKGLAAPTGLTDVPGEDGLLSAIAIGPVSVGIDAGRLQLYAGGVFDDPICTTSINHGVLAVGFGTEPSSGAKCVCSPVL